MLSCYLVTFCYISSSSSSSSSTYKNVVVVRLS